MTLGRQEINGTIGEQITSSLLLKRFWVLKRMPDVDGADFLVQTAHIDLQSIRMATTNIQCFGIVQSKYFEKKNPVRIQKHYVLDNDIPRSDFFCMVHSEDDMGKDVLYFFSAKDIVEGFEDKGKDYVFSITKKRTYEKYKNIDRGVMLDTIEQGMLSAEVENNKRYINRIFRIIITPTQHDQEIPDFEYSLKIIDGVNLVICRNLESGRKHLLEMRRDLHVNQGEFGWGGNGTGCKFLAASMLAHHLNGVTPSADDINTLVNNLISNLDPVEGHIILSGEVTTAISKRVTQHQLLAAKSIADLDQIYGCEREYLIVRGMAGNTLDLECKFGHRYQIPAKQGIVSAILILLPVAKKNLDATKNNLLIVASVVRDPKSERISSFLDVERVYFDN